MSDNCWAEDRNAEAIRQGLLADRATIIAYLREHGPSFASDIDAARGLSRGRAGFVAGRFSSGYFNISYHYKKDARSIFLRLKQGL